MVVKGTPADRDKERLDQLAGELQRRHHNLRSFSYDDAEAMSERLAARLYDRLGPEEIAQRYFVGVPRGGLIVLGLLAYALSLHPDQMAPVARRDRNAVLVDDVALTGHSLAKHIEAFGPSTVVALLAAEPQVRESLEALSSVSACVTAVDLASELDGLPQAVIEQLQNAWSSRLGDRIIPGSHSEPIAFPWSEPDSLLWDESTGQVEGGWQLVPPERSLKSRFRLGPPSPDRTGRAWRFPDDIALGHFDDGAILICRTTTNEVFRLDPVAASIWGTLGTLGNVEGTITHLMTRFETDEQTLRTDVNKLFDHFRSTGLLVANPGR